MNAKICIGRHDTPIGGAMVAFVRNQEQNLLHIGRGVLSDLIS